MLSSRQETAYQFGAAAYGICSLLALLPSLGFAAAAGMGFDAPEAENDLANWFAFYLLLAMPVVCSLTIALAFICFRQPTGRHALLMTAPLAAWGVAAVGIRLMA